MNVNVLNNITECLLTLAWLSRYSRMPRAHVSRERGRLTVRAISITIFSHVHGTASEVLRLWQRAISHARGMVHVVVSRLFSG